MLLISLDEYVARTKEWPRRSDLDAGSIHRPDITPDVQHSLKTHRAAVLVGAEGRGKSTLAKLVGLDAQRQGTPVWVIDCSDSGTQAAEHLATAIANSDTRRPLWIIEDCQIDSDAVEKLDGAIANATNSAFLFVVRNAGAALQPSEDRDDLEILDRIPAAQRHVVRPDHQSVRDIIEKYAEAYGLQERFIIRPSVTAADADWALAITGGNLRTLALYLDCWDPRAQALTSLTAGSIARVIVDSKLKPLAGTPDLVDAFLLFSAVTQLDIPVEASSVISFEALEELMRRGLAWSPDPDSTRAPGAYRRVYRPAHASDSRHVVMAYSWWTGRQPFDCTRDAVGRFLSADTPRARKAGTARAFIREYPGAFPLEWAVALRQDNPSTSLFLTLIEGVAAQDVAALVTAYGDDYVVEYLKKSKAGRARVLFRLLHETSETVAVRIESKLTLDDRINQYANSSMSVVAKALHFYHDQSKSRHFARRLLRTFVERSFEERVTRSAAGPCGRFLESAQRIDRTVAVTCARSIAGGLTLSSNISAEDLSLVLHHARFDEIAARTLTRRIVCECEPQSFAELPFRRGYTHLLKNILDCFPTDAAAVKRARMFFEFWVNQVNDDWASELSDRNVTATIWNCLVAGVMPSAWLNRCEESLLLRARHARPMEQFYFLWNILQADMDVYRRVGAAVAERYREQPFSVTGIGDLAVVGLLESTELLQAAPIASVPEQIVSLLTDAADATIRLYGIAALKWGAPAQFEAIAGHPSNPIGGAHDAINRHPLPESRERLRAELQRFGGTPI